ncbi:hypothetical protein [Roseibium sp. RKSG952]|uniref:hypothetical protein n=1 Tax=Roseibium sp. RKSG952 TaxID=2529384 RepID=UPI0012BC2CC7|nr:hypothetical protein [Roseibium sp. RKSG952]MTI03160.1 hypothetical protein [Roseibium sp. RKSG952]
MGRIITIILYVFVSAGPVWAGAWLREKGHGFTAVAVSGFAENDGTRKYKSSLYAEWGLRPKLTIGLDAEEHQDQYGHAVVFARFPLADLGDPGRFAAELGLGAHHRGLQSWAMYKATLSYGKGLQTGLGNGWLAVDTALEYRTHADLIRKLDVTVGLSTDRLLDPLLQIETYYAPGYPFYWSARPSLMIRPRKGKFTWIVGVEKTSAQDAIGARLALWRDF